MPSANSEVKEREFQPSLLSTYSDNFGICQLREKKLLPIVGTNAGNGHGKFSSDLPDKNR